MKSEKSSEKGSERKKFIIFLTNQYRLAYNALNMNNQSTKETIRSRIVKIFEEENVSYGHALSILESIKTAMIGNSVEAMLKKDYPEVFKDKDKS